MNDIERFSVNTYLKSLDTIPKTDPDETLGAALSIVGTSHKCVFVFTKENEFIGVVSPYKTLFQHRYPYTTKVGSIIYKPAKITVTTPIYKVASFMLSSRIYCLPVMDDKDEVMGVIYEKDLLKSIIKDKEILNYIASYIQINQPITASDKNNVGEIYQLLRVQGISRVILVDEENHVSGFVSRSDIMKAFIKPTDKQRFGKNGFRPTTIAFDEEKTFRTDDPVMKYALKLVETLKENTTKENIIAHLVNAEFNSVVLIDKDRKPTGFVSIRDILSSIAGLQPEPDINLIINKPSESVSEQEMQNAIEHFNKFGQKINKQVAIEKIEVSFEEPKYPDRKTASFNTTLIVTPIAGERLVAKTQRRYFNDAIHSVTELIEKQIIKNGKSRKETVFATL